MWNFSSSHKAAFCFIVHTLTKLQENIINSNRVFPTVVYRRKQLFQALTLRRTLVQGNCYRRTRLFTTGSTCKARLVTHSTHLTTLSTCSTRFSTPSTRFSTRCTRLSIRLSIRSSRLSTRSTRLSIRSICPLVVLVVLSVSLFITDHMKHRL